MPRTYPSARDRILDAAETIIVREGLGHLSVDAVLAETGLSKGGFFHHFATKEELLSAMTERLAAHAAHQISRVAAADTAGHGRNLRARIHAAFGYAPEERERLRALVLAVLEASRTSRAVTQQARAANTRELAVALEDGVPPGPALIVQFALDGYWIGESLGTSSLTPRQRESFRDALLALVAPPAKGPPRKVRS